jgi:hypothetical protein
MCRVAGKLTASEKPAVCLAHVSTAGAIVALDKSFLFIPNDRVVVR